MCNVFFCLLFHDYFFLLFMIVCNVSCLVLLFLGHMKCLFCCYCFLVVCNVYCLLLFHDYFFLLFMIVCNVFCLLLLFSFTCNVFFVVIVSWLCVMSLVCCYFMIICFYFS